MSANVNFCYQPSIYISRILPEHANVSFVISAINNYNLGEVSHIDFKESTSYMGSEASMYYAIVHFKHWNVEYTIDFRSTLMQGKFAKLYYNNFNFWKVSEYRIPTPCYPIAPGLNMNIMMGSGDIYYPPVPKLTRQPCKEFSEFDMFYRKLQMTDLFKSAQQQDIVFTCASSKQESAEECIEDDEYYRDEIDDDLANIVFTNITKRNKHDIKFHNGYKMFDIEHTPPPNAGDRMYSHHSYASFK